VKTQVDLILSTKYFERITQVNPAKKFPLACSFLTKSKPIMKSPSFKQYEI